jgi:hypothetical protein
MNLEFEIDKWSSRKVYWLCQLGGWTALALYQSSAGVSDSTDHLPPPTVAIAEPLFSALYGLIVTHLLYLYLRRRGWLQKLGPRLALRLAAVILLLSAGLNALDLSSIYLLDHWFAFHLPFDRRIVLLSLGSWIVVMVAWMALYLAIHELRRRRSQDVRALRMEVMAQEAQLRGLRAQLNPHFLFNCLNSLREMVVENPQRAELMVTQLSDLMRYALQSNQGELVALASEVQAVRDYLALETIRFEERLRVTWDIADEALDLRVPPMLLQTLVENALKHGIAPRPQGGDIKIVARHQSSGIQLEVVNSGRISRGETAGGVGLCNARERLHLLYGQRAQLRLEDADDDHVRAMVKLPLAQAEVLG